MKSVDICHEKHYNFYRIKILTVMCILRKI